jgi:hypothetical protein
MPSVIMSRPRLTSKLQRLNRSALAGGAQVRFTPLMQKRLTRRAEEMIGRALNHFPELEGRTITIGYTRVHLGSAVISRARDSAPQLVIRLKVRKLTYQTIGHELTHLVQALSLGERPPPAYERIPTGEAQCDIWTLARHALFCDDAPTYIKMPRLMRELWPNYAMAVRRLCIAAIEKRSSFRPYIRWLESEIAALVRAPRREKTVPAQLTLPFVD